MKRLYFSLAIAASVAAIILFLLKGGPDTRSGSGTSAPAEQLATNNAFSSVDIYATPGSGGAKIGSQTTPSPRYRTTAPIALYRTTVPIPIFRIAKECGFSDAQGEALLQALYNIRQRLNTELASRMQITTTPVGLRTISLSANPSSAKALLSEFDASVVSIVGRDGYDKLLKTEFPELLLHQMNYFGEYAFTIQVSKPQKEENDLTHYKLQFSYEHLKDATVLQSLDKFIIINHYGPLGRAIAP